MCENIPYGLIHGNSILTRDGIIDWIGPENELPNQEMTSTIVDGAGKFLSPGLIDCHTHLVYGGSRADEWEMRLTGVPYEEIARRGGGILSTVTSTRNSTEDELFASALKRLQNLICQGVTTVEIKTGYGLDLETELKMLRVINRLRNESPIEVSRTLLAAHAVPPEFATRADEYVELVCGEIIPAAAELCDAIDVFCESIAFNVDQTRRIFEAAKRTRPELGLKIHAEQLTHLGGASLAAEMGAMSADHVEYLQPTDCQLMAKSNTVATLLPGAFYNLKETQIPPVGELRKASVPIAIATDANPGSSPVSSILLMAHMACTFFGLTPEESIRGLTENAAKALRLDAQIGSLEIGKRADFAVWDIESPAELAYGIGHSPCTGVYVGGIKIDAGQTG